MVQLFGKTGNAQYEPYWCEMNGHAFCMYLSKTDKVPAVRFDLKEVRRLVVSIFSKGVS
jgi:hypothetical protein